MRIYGLNYGIQRAAGLYCDAIGCTAFLREYGPPYPKDLLAAAKLGWNLNVLGIYDAALCPEHAKVLRQ